MSADLLNHFTQNGGTVMAIAGESFAILSSDSRISTKEIILSNDQLKIFNLKNKTAIGLIGNFADALEIYKNIQEQIEVYEKSNEKRMSLNATAQMVSILLYKRRIFPYWIQGLLVGLDKYGRGGIYSFDPVGHCEKVPYKIQGTAAKAISASISCLLNEKCNEDFVDKNECESVKHVKELFSHCCEVDPSTGGYCEIWVLKRNELGEVEIDISRQGLRCD